jgi:hypothetical protein
MGGVDTHQTLMDHPSITILRDSVDYKDRILPNRLTAWRLARQGVFVICGEFYDQGRLFQKAAPPD